MVYSFDHAVIFVDDLSQAIADYTTLGFCVARGGTHAGGLTRNALIPFADGTYLELLAFTIPDVTAHVVRLRDDGLLAEWLRDRTAMDRRFVPRAARGEGCQDFALRVADIDRLTEEARMAGLSVDGPYPGERIRQDGTALQWRLAMPQSADLPFLIEDVTAHDLRVPAGEAAEHPNGVVGFHQITVWVHDPPASARRYTAWLAQQAPSVVNDTIEFPLALGKLRIGHGREPDGAFRLHLRSTRVSSPHRLDPVRSHRADIQIAPTDL